MRRLVLTLLVVACGSEPAQNEPIPATPPPKVAATPRAACEETPVSPTTEAIYAALRGGCVGCHDQGVRGYFASLEAFQALVVADPRLVVPGDPGASELIRLLEGQGTRAFSQMPIGGMPYAATAPAGAMDQIRAWITGLGMQVRSVRPDRDAPVITRMSAAQIQRSLYQQLGLSHADFFTAGAQFELPYAASRQDADYPMQSSDALPAPYEREAAERYYHLGGGSVNTQVAENREIAPTFVHALTAISQRWCRMGLLKAGNTALFPAGTRMDRAPDAVRATIRRWSRHFHGHTMSADEIEQTYQSVFVALEPQGNEAAHVGLCSYFIRHPRWIFY